MNEKRADGLQPGHGDLAPLQRSIEQLETTNQRQAREIERLLSRLAEAEQTLASVYGSRGWRTLRAVSRKLQRGRALKARSLAMLAGNRKSASAEGATSIRGSAEGTGAGNSARLVAVNTLRLGAVAVRLLPDYLRIRRSGLFDGSWYLDTYPDVASAGRPPLLHFLRRGLSEGRSPGPGFDSAFYLDSYPDVAASGTPALLHYLRHGKREARAPIGANGARHAGGAAAQYRRSGAEASGNGSIEPSALSAVGESARRMLANQAVLAHEYQPRISILLPTWNTPLKYLRIAIASVLDQDYPNWELCIVDDGSTSVDLPAYLDELPALDSRIRVERMTENGGISVATNRALEIAGGEFVAMLDHDDVIDPDALIEVVAALQADPGLDAVYTDQDYIETDGSAGESLLKPDWAPLLACGVMYIGHLLVVRRAIARDVGGFDRRFDRVQDFEFMLRVSERTRRIHHVPKVLYHWRRIPGSVAYDGNAKGRIETLQAHAVSAHLARIGVALRAVPHHLHAHRVALEATTALPESRVLVLLGSTQGSKVTTPVTPKGLEALSAHPRHRFVVLRMPESKADATDNDADDGVSSAGSWLDTHARGDRHDFIVGWNTSGHPLGDDWFERLAAFAGIDDVGVVSAAIVSPDLRVIDAGMIASTHAGLRPALSGRHVDEDGYAGSLSCAREVSAVSGRFCMISRTALARAGGFDASIATAALAWTDLSLRCLRNGLRCVVVPQVRVLAPDAIDPPAAASSPDAMLDRLLIEERWLKPGFADRYHNQAFTIRGGGYRIATRRRRDDRVAA